MPLGKTIRLYLIDGSATGPIAAEIINWTGQVVGRNRPWVVFTIKEPGDSNPAGQLLKSHHSWEIVGAIFLQL